MKLIITEKPSVARDIAKVLNINTRHEGYFENKDFIITWAFGHLITLSQPDEYGKDYEKWSFDHLPIIPAPFKTKVIDSSKDQLNLILSLFKKPLTSVICATDAGREGELIFRHIYTHANSELPIERLWISSQTDQAIKDGFNGLKNGIDYDPLYASALSRSEADWIVGINATRAYTIKFSRGHGVMSVGRVQTPVLKLIVDRCRAHRDFQSNAFYEILATIKHQNGSFDAKLIHGEDDRFTDKSQADTILKTIQSIPSGIIEKLTQKQIIEKQPLLYDLTELQKDANKQFNLSADDTLTHMQSLYEKHKILTYPRTSSRYLSQDIAPKLPQLLSTIANVPGFEDAIKTVKNNSWTIAKRLIDDKKVTDHHAIIPTDKTPNVAALSGPERQIYELVIRRFISAFYPECEKHHTEIISKFGDYSFKSTGTIITKAGWRELNDTDSSSKESLLPNVAENDPITHDKVKVKKGQTKAPPLYTESSILAAMETAGKFVDDDEARQAMKHCGLGTAATRAQIIEKLIQVKYIERQKNKLVSTQKGESIIDYIGDSPLTSPELTGTWEQQLNLMAEGKADRDSFMKEIVDLTKDVTQSVNQSNVFVIGADQAVLGSCPACQEGKIVELPKSYSCTHWKSHQCPFVIWKTIAQKSITLKQAESLVKKGKTSVIKGFKSKAGKSFDAALTYSEKDQRITFDFHQETLGGCPKCDGEIVETPKAYSCNKWRETQCNFVIWKNTSNRPITKSEAKKLLKQGSLKGLKGFSNRQGQAFDGDMILTEQHTVSVTPSTKVST